MRGLVVYESMFGNTAAIARAVAAGIGIRASVALIEVGNAPLRIDERIDLVVVGGPTHSLGLSSAATRRSAADDALGGVLSQTCGLREWLAAVRFLSPTTYAASFDTRIAHPKLPGSAAGATTRRLRRRKVSLLSPPTSFFVADKLGPLVEGELDRAQAWGESLIGDLTSSRGLSAAG